MPAPRRLPLATLARASGGRRRAGRGRIVAVACVLVAATAVALWYFRFRPQTSGTLTPIDEAVAETPANAPSALSEVETAPAAPAVYTFGATATPASPAATTPPGTAPAAAPNATNGSPTTPASMPALAKPTAPGSQTTPPAHAADLPAVEKDFKPRVPRDVFEAQVALMRDAICPGSIDGSWGGQTRNAVAAFQEKHGLRVTGQLDNATREALKLKEQPLRYYVVTENDVSRLRPFPKGWQQKSDLDFMGYASVLEAVAERSYTNPKYIMRLNPQVDWTLVKPGTQLVVTNIGTRAAPPSRPEFILISLSAKTLQLYDASSQLLAHFPCSIARRVEKRPVGELSVLTVALSPNYTFNPETFPDSPEAQKIGRKLILQPGPNNPVGTAWIALSAGDGSYGIHGSPEPEQIGRTESSGCFRLANWNAEYLAPLVRAGMVVRVEP